MILWTIQPVEFYNELLDKGIVWCDATKSENIKDFKKAYNFMIYLMGLHGIKRPKYIDYPLWAWRVFDGRIHKPDLRLSAYDARGTKSVCLEIEIPDNEVLLTEFNYWHSVLNNSFLDTSTTEEEFVRQHEWFDNLNNKDKEKVKRKSWFNILNIRPFHNEWLDRGRYVQATFWQLKIEQVRKVQYFTCR